MKAHFYDSLNQGVINLSDLAYLSEPDGPGSLCRLHGCRSPEVELMARKKQCVRALCASSDSSLRHWLRGDRPARLGAGLGGPGPLHARQA